MTLRTPWLTEKGEQMEQNRQQELDKVAEKAKKRDEQMRRAAERKKKFQAEGGKGSPLGSNDKLQDE